MRRFTVFTLLYLTLGICFTVLAFQQPNLDANVKEVLFLNAGLLYLCTVLSTFRFWQQASVNSWIRLREQPAWKQKLFVISPWMIIAVELFSVIFSALIEHRTTAALTQAVSGLTLILLSIEILFTRSQI